MSGRKWFVLTCGLLELAASVRADEVARTATLSVGSEGVVFAVPDGCAFVRATAVDVAGGAVPLVIGEPSLLNYVTLVPVASAVPTNATVTAVFADGAEPFVGRPAKVLRERIRSLPRIRRVRRVTRRNRSTSSCVRTGTGSAYRMSFSAAAGSMRRS